MGWCTRWWRFHSCTDANDDSTFGIIAGLFLAFYHTEVDNDSSFSTIKKHNQTKQCNILGSILTHSRGSRPWGWGLRLSWRRVQTLHTGPVVGSLISLPVLWWWTWAVLLCLNPPSPCRQANNIRVNGKSWSQILLVLSQLMKGSEIVSASSSDVI